MTNPKENGAEVILMHFASNESAKISDWIIRDQLSALHLAASSSRHTACCHLRLQMRCSGNRATCQSFSAPNCVPLANALAPASVSVNHSQTSLVQKKQKELYSYSSNHRNFGYANLQGLHAKGHHIGPFFFITKKSAQPQTPWPQWFEVSGAIPLNSKAKA